MQVQSVSVNPGFQGRRDRIDEAINLDDRTIQQVSYARALNVTEDKKHNKLSKAMFFSIPVVAGIAAAILTPAIFKGKMSAEMFRARSLNGVYIDGASAKLLGGLKSAGRWLVGLGVAGGAIFGHRKLAEKSETVDNFDRKHPFLSVIATGAAAVGALMLGAAGVSKIGNKLSPKFWNKLQDKTYKAAVNINKNKFINKSMDKMSKLTAKVPSPLRNFGAFALSWAPEAMLLGGLIHTCNHASARDSAFINNYNDMKTRQFDLSKARLREISKHNKALMHENEYLQEENKNLTNLVDKINAEQAQAQKAANVEAVAEKIDEAIDAKIEEKVAEKLEEVIEEAKVEVAEIAAEKSAEA